MCLKKPFQVVKHYLWEFFPLTLSLKVDTVFAHADCSPRADCDFDVVKCEIECCPLPVTNLLLAYSESPLE